LLTGYHDLWVSRLFSIQGPIQNSLVHLLVAPTTTSQTDNPHVLDFMVVFDFTAGMKSPFFVHQVLIEKHSLLVTDDEVERIAKLVVERP
jgi:hypothetical protein